MAKILGKLKEPVVFINAWRILNIFILTHLWIISESSINSFSLILLLCILTSLRLRFNLSNWCTLIEVLICLLFAPYTIVSHYGLVIPIFELALKGKWKFSILIIISLFITSTHSSLLFWYFIICLFFGTFYLLC